jgi:hypothetical protein
MNNIDIEIFIGAPIEEESERHALIVLLNALTKRGKWAVVFANFNLATRQIDLLVGTDQQALVIEVKGITRAIQDAPNGDWQMRTSGGVWKRIRNPYQQVLQAKYALRDEMARGSPALTGYPNACVVFAPRLPSGSQLGHGDHKVSFWTLEELAEQMDGISTMRWEQSDWHAFAVKHRLTQVESSFLACSPRLFAAEKLLERYTTAFRTTYAPISDSYQNDSYQVDDHEQDASAILNLLHDNDTDLLIQGPSGCGKSLFVLKIANEVLDTGVVPLLLVGKIFEGRMAHALDREAVLLDAPSAKALVNAARQLGRPLLLIVDGYNECPDSERPALTRSIRAAALRFDAKIVITTQSGIWRGDLLGLKSVLVKKPSMELKVRIAGFDTSSEEYAKICHLLDAVNTGLEASLVGFVGKDVLGAPSRFALFDHFARHKLGAAAAEGIQLLAEFAGALAQRLKLTLSIRELDRMVAVLGISHAAYCTLMASNLILVRGDRVSFSHELFFNAFSAEAIIRRANGNAVMIIEALEMPRYRDCRNFIVGAIEDDHILEQVLHSISESSLLLECVIGTCGSSSRRIISKQCDALVERMSAEVAALRFDVVDNSWMNVAIVRETLFDWSVHDLGILMVLGHRLGLEKYLPELLECAAKMDQCLINEFRRLLPFAMEKKISLRSGLFANAYLSGSKSAGLSRLSSFLQRGGFSFSEKWTPEQIMAIKSDWTLVKSPGQLYLLLALTRSRRDKIDAAKFVLPWLQPDRWKFIPYHLRLALLEFANCAWAAEQSVQDEFIRVLTALLPDLNPVFTGMVFEILGTMGALESEEQDCIESVRSMLREILRRPADEGARQTAYSIYFAQFDHPLAGAYVQAIEELTAEERKVLLRLACEGASSSDFFLGALLDEMAEAGDSSFVDAICRWTQLPDRHSSMPQQAVEVFMTAHMALGRLGVELRPGQEYPSCDIAAIALRACGEVYYWQERAASDVEQLEAHCTALMDVLLKQGMEASAGILFLISRSLSGKRARANAIEKRFPMHALAICRAALRNPEIQCGYFDHAFMAGRSEILSYAVTTLGKRGDETDLSELRKWCDNKELGLDAVTAIRAIELRTALRDEI